MYHGVAVRDHSTVNGRHLNVAQFEQHLCYFKKNFEILSLQEISEEEKKFRKPFVALTFDDGFENNFTNALPLLEKYKIPATFFIPAIILDTETVLYPDRIDIVKWGNREKELVFDGQSYTRRGQRLISKATGKNIHTHLVMLSPSKLDKTVNEFCKRYQFDALKEKCDPECYRLMNKEQLREAASSDFMHIGSHAYAHYGFSACSNQETERELNLSKQKLEHYCGKPVTAVAFPYGSYTDNTVIESRKAGYKFLLAAGSIDRRNGVMPRAGIISAGSFEQNMLLVHSAFDRFGF